jgi:hypothetical protein
MNLYRVTLRGMTSQIGGSQAYGVAYVVALNAEDAYRAVRKQLDREDIGFAKDRSLERVELLAEDAAYPECGHRLYVDG